MDVRGCTLRHRQKQSDFNCQLNHSFILKERDLPVFIIIIFYMGMTRPRETCIHKISMGLFYLTLLKMTSALFEQTFYMKDD